MNEGEKRVVGRMIAIYCRSNHGVALLLCEECASLYHYAVGRLEKCPFGENKPTCVSCPIHCYKKEMRSKIRQVMRFAGPRMLLYHPLDTIRHFYSEFRQSRIQCGLRGNFPGEETLNNRLRWKR